MDFTKLSTKFVDIFCCGNSRDKFVASESQRSSSRSSSSAMPSQLVKERRAQSRDAENEGYRLLAGSSSTSPQVTGELGLFTIMDATLARTPDQVNEVVMQMKGTDFGSAAVLLGRLARNLHQHQNPAESLAQLMDFLDSKTDVNVHARRSAETGLGRLSHLEQEDLGCSQQAIASPAQLANFLRPLLACHFRVPGKPGSVAARQEKLHGIVKFLPPQDRVDCLHDLIRAMPEVDVRAKEIINNFVRENVSDVHKTARKDLLSKLQATLAGPVEAARPRRPSVSSFRALLPRRS